MNVYILCDHVKHFPPARTEKFYNISYIVIIPCIHVLCPVEATICGNFTGNMAMSHPAVKGILLQHWYCAISSFCIHFALVNVYLGIGTAMALVLTSAAILVGTILGLIVKRRQVQTLIQTKPVTTSVQNSSKYHSKFSFIFNH